MKYNFKQNSNFSHHLHNKPHVNSNKPQIKNYFGIHNDFSSNFQSFNQQSFANLFNFLEQMTNKPTFPTNIIDIPHHDDSGTHSMRYAGPEGFDSNPIFVVDNGSNTHSMRYAGPEGFC